jgi:hypothetical protein
VSIEAMRVVWKAPLRPTSRKLTLLALADWSNDEGTSLFPSIAAIARKVGVTRGQAQRLMRRAIEDKIVEVLAHEKGGPPGTTKQLLLRLDLIAALTAAESSGATRPPIHTDGTGAMRVAPGQMASMHESDRGDARNRTAPAPSYPSFNHQGSTVAPSAACGQLDQANTKSNAAIEKVQGEASGQVTGFEAFRQRWGEQRAKKGAQ